MAQRTLPGDQPHSQAHRRVTAEWSYFLAAAEVAVEKKRDAEEAELNKKAEGTKALAKAGTNGQKPVSGGGGAAARNDPDQIMQTAHPLSKEYAAAFEAKHGFPAPTP